MKGDQLLQQWKQAKQTCQKIIQISISSNLHQVVLGKQSNQQFMKVYDVVYRLCSNRQSEQTRVVMVYKDYKEMLKNALLKLSKQLQKERDICKLKVLKKIWDAYEDIMKRLKHMFAYLNRPFHIKEGKLEDLDRTGMVLIVHTFFNEETLLQFGLIYFKNLHKMRESHDYTDSQLLKDYVDILYRIHLRLMKKQNKRARTLYTDFQQKYLAEAREFYKANYTTLKEFSPSEYFIEINQLFEREKKLAEECFAIGWENLINKVFSEQFLEEYREKLIMSPKGLKAILQNRQSKTIKVITELYKQLTNSIDGFKEPFQSFIYEQFSGILQESRSQISLLSAKAPKTHHYISLVKTLITRSKQLIEILKTSFMKHNQFISYYKNGIQRAYSRNTLAPPIQEILSIYLDHQLKQSFSTQDELSDNIHAILSIFQCIQNKDLFLMKYLQRFCRNILVLTVEGVSNHQAFIYGLKMHSGIRVTERLETIVDQYKMAAQETRNDGQGIIVQDNYQTFKQFSKNQKLPYKMNLWIFSEGVWPYPESINIQANKIPFAMRQGLQCIKNYQQIAVKKKVLKLSFVDSKIRWVYHFDKQYQNKQKITQQQFCYFDTNAIQAILLLYIYERRPNRVGLNLMIQVFSEIKSQVVQQSLKKLSQGENHILNKEVQEEQIMYSFNKSLHTKKRLINFDTTNIQEAQSEQLFQKAEIGRDREFTIDANIAKLMKSKKILSYDRLAEQIIKMIKVFTPSLKDIKASVQRLLQKQLLTRDQKDKSILRYKD